MGVVYLLDLLDFLVFFYVNYFFLQNLNFKMSNSCFWMLKWIHHPQIPRALKLYKFNKCYMFFLTINLKFILYYVKNKLKKES